MAHHCVLGQVSAPSVFWGLHCVKQGVTSLPWPECGKVTVVTVGSSGASGKGPAGTSAGSPQALVLSRSRSSRTASGLGRSWPAGPTRRARGHTSLRYPSTCGTRMPAAPSASPSCRRYGPAPVLACLLAHSLQTWQCVLGNRMLWPHPCVTDPSHSHKCMVGGGGTEHPSPTHWAARAKGPLG